LILVRLIPCALFQHFKRRTETLDEWKKKNLLFMIDVIIFSFKPDLHINTPTLLPSREISSIPYSVTRLLEDEFCLRNIYEYLLSFGFIENWSRYY